jgi:hypothetical protein
MNPLENLSENDREVAKRMLKIMGSDKNPNAEELQYLINHASPMVSIMQKAIHKRLVALGVDSDESLAMVTVLADMGNIAGGISFADFAITEKMATNLDQ